MSWPCRGPEGHRGTGMGAEASLVFGKNSHVDVHTASLLVGQGLPFLHYFKNMLERRKEKEKEGRREEKSSLLNQRTILRPGAGRTHIQVKGVHLSINSLCWEPQRGLGPLVPGRGAGAAVSALLALLYAVSRPGCECLEVGKPVLLTVITPGHSSVLAQHATRTNAPAASSASLGECCKNTPRLMEMCGHHDPGVWDSTWA